MPSPSANVARCSTSEPAVPLGPMLSPIEEPAPPIVAP